VSLPRNVHFPPGGVAPFCSLSPFYIARAPIESTMGFVQKIFYFTSRRGSRCSRPRLSAAFGRALLVPRQARADRVASAAAELASSSA
jgi:hypothetical protein